MDRRGFMKSLAGAGAAAIAGPSKRIFAKSNADYFKLNPMIEALPPWAVFIKKTNASSLTDSVTKSSEGLALALDLFVPSDEPGGSNRTKTQRHPYAEQWLHKL